jgi:hypothetical protein
MEQKKRKQNRKENKIEKAEDKGLAEGFNQEKKDKLKEN